MPNVHVKTFIPMNSDNVERGSAGDREVRIMVIGHLLISFIQIVPVSGQHYNQSPITGKFFS